MYSHYHQAARQLLAEAHKHLATHHDQGTFPLTDSLPDSSSICMTATNSATVRTRSVAP
ncbi:hypothetical protein ACFC0M_03890 [Streptomyces sp. NPDC056149]|uniref:hypothetical protein n=1 Tax=Streptomyces sp. NPDC056149 TaxID=3345728 RepID=UPI0035E2C3A0